MNMGRAGLLIVALATSACRSAFAAGQLPATGTVVPIARFREGPTAYSTYSGITDSLRALIRDSVAWRALWQRVNRPFIPEPTLPQVDFHRDMVVVAALGARSTGGYDVVIEGADQDAAAGGIEVAVRRTAPAAGCPVAAVVTQPVDLAKIPASDQPVRFRERSITIPCGTGCVTKDTVRRAHVLPALGLHVGTPQKASLALGVVLGEDWQENGRDHSRNVALFAEPGLSAGRASLAYVRHGYGSFGSGFGIAATLLRTWKDPWTVSSNMSFVGLEALVWPVVFVGPRIGVFHSVSGTPTPNRWFVGVDFGFGV